MAGARGKTSRDGAVVPKPTLPVAAFPRWTGGDWGGAGLCALAAFAVYWATLAPTVSGEDSGELIVAAYTLGVAHPPGYPLWCLLGRLFTLIPLGDIAWRVNLMSAIFGAVSVGLVYLLARRWCASRVAAAAGALAFAFSAEFWEQALIAEVYTLNAFFVALCLLLLLAWRDRRDDRLLFAFAAAYGLSLTNHQTMLLLGPIFVACVLCWDAGRLGDWRRWGVYAGCTALALACLSVYLYLPLRAIADPPVNWGNPDNWERFWAHVTRRQYTAALTENPRTLARAAGQLGAYGRLYAGELTVWLAWLPLLGLAVLWARSRAAALLLGAVFLVSGPGMALLLNFESDRQSLWLNNVFWIPSYLVAALLLGVAMDALATRVPGVAARRAALATGLAVATVLPLATHYARNDKSAYRFAEEFGRNLLAGLDADAIYFPTADHATFPVLYLQVVEGLRPDVTLANKYGYPERSVYAGMPEDFLRGLPEVPNAVQERIIEDWVVAESGRPVHFTRRRSMEGLPEHRLEQAGLTFRVARKDAPAASGDPWAAYSWTTLELADTAGELTATYIVSDYHYFRGRALLEAGATDEADAHFAMAAEAGGESKELLNNIASAYAELGHLGKAEEYYRRTLALDPAYHTARKNLAKTFLQRGRREEALLELEEVLRVVPEDAEAVRMSAEGLAALAWTDEAIARYEHLVRLRPRDATALRELAMLHLHQKQDPFAARRWLTRALRADPDHPGLAELLAAVGGDSPTAAPSGGTTPPLPTVPGVPSIAPPQPPTPPVPGASLPGGPNIP